MKVLKFGGTSVGTSDRIRHVAQLIREAGRNVVVLSAMSGTTNTLSEVADYLHNRNRDGAKDTIKLLEDKYLKIAAELFSDPSSRAEAENGIRETFSSLLSLTRELFGPVQERIVLAQGELLSTRLMELYLKETGVDVLLLPALSFMKLDAQGEPDLDYIREHLLPMMERKADVYLTQGYICRNADNEVDNLQRGGSDYTASLIGAALTAEEIQIWTDIDGMHNNDPRIVEHTAAVRHLHFEEAAELAYFGAKILHPTCIQPAKHANIPVRLLNTLEPQAPGTLIDNNPEPGTIKAVAAKDNITAIKIKSSRMLLAHGFLRKVFEIFESYRTPIDMICTSEVGVSLTVDQTRYLSEIVHELKHYGTVTVDLDMCIVCVVGDMDWENVGFESRVLAAMKDIPVRMVGYGGSNYNISLLVRSEDKVRALQGLSRHLFQEC
ncbi:MAG: aspartate kinase [Bacteroidales bacterium]|nr:aspartate kinase [Bacteroidales bacterium]